MTLTTPVATHADHEGAAVALRRAFELQRAAFARRAPDRDRRMEALAAFRDAVRAHEDELVQAVSDDFGGRAREETRMLELLPLYDQIRHARRHLDDWMKPRRVRSAWFLRPSRNYIVPQPLGVVGVIGAWNYPVMLTLGPLIDALAAGNHVMIKPSEIAPRTAELMASMLAERFTPDYVTVVTGGVDVASAFSSLPFDHLIFTGSTRVGALVMRAASEHLTPVTLELGGKSPAIVHDAFPLATAMRRLLTGKLYNAGQTCVAPDYLLVPHARLPEVERLAREVVDELYPTLADNPDYTRIISDRHYDRLTGLLREAEGRGARVVRLGRDDESATRANHVFRPTLVFGAPDDADLMREEIFGPILPVVGYGTLDEAIGYVNARPRPLALYYFDRSRKRIDRVIAETTSGGVLVNDVVMHLGQPNLPFGGVGQSGMGHYHGRAGFERFSKQKGVMVQSRFTAAGLLRAPYGARMRFLLERTIRQTLR